MKSSNSVNIVCFIPNKLEFVSKYVLGIIGQRLGINFEIKIHDQRQYKLSYDQKELNFSCLFIDKESGKWLSQRDSFEFELDQFELDGVSYFAIKDHSVEDSKTVSIDIIGTIFLLLSRYEEHVLHASAFDKFDRFNPEYAINFEVLNRPIVDELISCLEVLIQKELDIRTPQIKTSFQVSPSHDVDRPFEFLYYSNKKLLKRILGDVLVRHSVKMALDRYAKINRVKNGSFKSDPYYTFDWIIEQSEKYSRRSIFYFISESTHPEFDQDYELSSPEITNLLTLIADSGHSIGLHPSFRSSEISGQVSKEYTKLTELLRELRIEQKEYKSRYHYLRWNCNSVTELGGAGIDVDQTLCYAQKPGFRCGTSHRYPAFDFSLNSASKLDIEPLIVMEQSLFNNSYLGLANKMEDAWNIVSDLKNECKKHNGNFTLLWHNSELITNKMKDFYVECIK